MPAALQTVECLYVGRRVLANGKLAEGYLTAELAKSLTDAGAHVFERAVSLFDAPKRSKGHAKSGAVVGGVYKMEVELVDGRVNTAKPASREFVRRYEDKAVVVECETRDDAADMHARTARMMTKLKNDDMVGRELSMLRRLYLRTPHADRTALELLVLKSLRGS